MITVTTIPMYRYGCDSCEDDATYTIETTLNATNLCDACMQKLANLLTARLGRP